MMAAPQAVSCTPRQGVLAGALCIRQAWCLAPKLPQRWTAPGALLRKSSCVSASGLADGWSLALRDAMETAASVWPQVRASVIASQRSAVLPPVVSCQRDWRKFAGTIHEIRASEICFTLSRQDALARHRRKSGCPSAQSRWLGMREWVPWRSRKSTAPAVGNGNQIVTIESRVRRRTHR
jgi:hypothetical protein